MLGNYRKEYVVRIVLLTAMVWGFALPVVHLVCGMSIEQESVLCDNHAATEGQDESAAHAPYAAMDHAVHAGVDHAVHTSVDQTVYPGVAHAAYADDGFAVEHAVFADYGYAVERSTATFETRDTHVECCWVDANAVDRRAPLPSLTQVPDLAVSHSDATTTDPLPEVRTVDLVVADDASPPISFRLLFSVFLI